MAINQCFAIKAPVGATFGAPPGLINLPEDVRIVQRLLNEHAPRAGYLPLMVTGWATPDLTSAISTFQQKVVGMQTPTGRVDPGGTTLLRLNEPPGFAVAPSPTVKLSGAAWWHSNQARFPNSTSPDDLEATFGAKVKEFLAALHQAGASVAISSTRRNKHRAYLMHYSWMIARGQIKASAVPADADVDIIWDHGNESKSKIAAQEMVKLFGMAHIAALNSMHISGHAIDMTITWTGTLKIKNTSGATISVGAPHNGNENTTLHTVGATYGVKKLVTDPPHWSSNGT